MLLMNVDLPAFIGAKKNVKINKLIVIIILNF